MAMEYKYGQMEPDMKVNGKIIEPMDKENLFTLMEIFMREIG